MSESNSAGGLLQPAAEALERDIEARVRADQGGVRTFFDNYLLRTIHMLRGLDSQGRWEDAALGVPGAQGERLRTRVARLRAAIARRGAARLAEYAARQPVLPEAAPWPSAIDPATLAMSQGTAECMHWRGQPLFKTAFDFAVYSMLMWDLRPRTVLEIGSGSGASALWLADLQSLAAAGGHVYSLDLHTPSATHPGVSFLSGDCRRIAEALPARLLDDLPHPWLVIEDAHVNVAGVLTHLHGFIVAGDYMVVEDSAEKQGEITAFLSAAPGAYKVDTRYTDFFGRNATCAFDSIFMRV